MDSKVTISEVDYKPTAQQPTGVVRSAVVAGKTRRIITNHQTSTVKGIGRLVRTLRKVEFDETITLGDGSTVSAPVSVAITILRPSSFGTNTIDAPISTMLAWAAQSDFVADVKADLI